MEELTLELTLSELVMRFPAASYLFEKYDLDYCCHGNKTLYEACEGDLKKYGRVKNALDEVFERARTCSNFVHFDNMEVPELVDYIYSRHHSYVKEAMPIIHEHLKKVSAKHGDNHPELNEVFRLFQEMEHEMNQHILREEQVLFPSMKQLHAVFHSGNIHGVKDILYMSAPVHTMETEHEKSGSVMHLIRELTNNFTPPVGACTTFRLSYNELKEFEHDLHQHVHLENNILFPKVLEMQKNLLTILSN